MDAISEGATSFLITEYKYMGVFMVCMERWEESGWVGARVLVQNHPHVLLPSPPPPFLVQAFQHDPGDSVGEFTTPGEDMSFEFIELLRRSR